MDAATLVGLLSGEMLRFNKDAKESADMFAAAVGIAAERGSMGSTGSTGCDTGCQTLVWVCVF